MMIMLTFDRLMNPTTVLYKAIEAIIEENLLLNEILRKHINEMPMNISRIDRHTQKNATVCD